MRSMKESKILVWLFCLLLICFFIQIAKIGDAEEKYPTRLIKFIVPAPAGGPTDVVCRKMADLAGKSLGQEVIIENRPGGASLVAMTFLAKSKPDGYTIGAVTSGIYFTLPFFTRMEFDPFTDLTPILLYATANASIFVTMDSPIKTFDDFVEEGRKRQILVGNGGALLLGTITLQRLGVLAKMNIKHIPFNGTAQCVAPLLGRQVDAMVVTGLMPYVRSGKMRIIARLTEGPITEYKDVLHVKDYGYDINSPGCVGIVGPKGLPRHIHKKLEEEFSRAVHDPSVIQIIDSYGETMNFKNSVDFESWLKKEHVRVKEMMEALELGIYAKDKK